MAWRTNLTYVRLFRSAVLSGKPTPLRSLSSFSHCQIGCSGFTLEKNQLSSCRNFFGTPLGVGINIRAYSTPSLADEVLKSKVSSPDKSSGEKSSGDQEQEPPKGPKPLTKWQKIGYAAFGLFFAGGIIVNAIVFCKNTVNIRKPANVRDLHARVHFQSLIT